MLAISEFDILNEDYDDELLERIKADFGKEELEGGMYYEVVLQDNRFSCAYTDKEMRSIISTCIKIIKELINIHDSGYSREQFDQTHEENNDEENPLKPIYSVYLEIQTPALRKLIDEMACYTRTDGAFFMLIAAPCLISTIYSVFDVMLNDYDDEDIWFSCLYFLIRGAMKMHSQSLSSKDV
ncbi:hypothetical protein [Butyrivibrio sp. WCE2006]|uniref:hypothetical protein n=1 Tax=Butyrivibrio sp. WCE2006 TaxID=1410611 RepID=UPI0005D14CF5|nr:hypothetical protein [Butyrivibrio sp. WCE2006]